VFEQQDAFRFPPVVFYTPKVRKLTIITFSIPTAV